MSKLKLDFGGSLFLMGHTAREQSRAIDSFANRFLGVGFAQDDNRML